MDRKLLIGIAVAIALSLAFVGAVTAHSDTKASYNDIDTDEHFELCAEMHDDNADHEEMHKLMHGDNNEMHEMMHSMMHGW